MKIKSQKANGITDLITKIGAMAEELMQKESKTRNPEQYAFLFGHVNMAAALTTALKQNSGKVVLNTDYITAHTSYKEAKQEFEEFKKEFEQIDLIDIFPELFKAYKKHKQNRNKE